MIQTIHSRNRRYPMTQQSDLERNQELQELINMAKERVGDLLSDAEIEEVAQSVLEEMEDRNRRFRGDGDFQDLEDSEEKPRKRGRPRIKKEENDRVKELEDEIERLNQEKALAEKQVLRLRFEGLVNRWFYEQKLTPVIVNRDDLVNYLEGLETGTLQLDQDETVTTFLIDLLEALPSQID
ncbi:hypothetical protein PCC6311_1606 [Synechococcus elongatus PCC 6311]|nr:hypothetical protein PCC7943_1630 [Synechococcus elongatus PCC 7943]UOW74075.1 hypothetical protein PCC6311_1606 [Synechococcus elongatus PCC 6311]UOW76796.1 hypothetical protein PCC6301pg_1607 [Synechococcus elongatus PCC 6301]BAD78209.1 unknown protein [Synechococcus elongatus PCC 6301]